MSFSRTTHLLGLLLISFGCSRKPPATAAAPSEGKLEETTIDPASAARNSARDATAEGVPRPPSDPDLETSQAYMNGELKEWFARAAPRVEQAHQEYSRLIRDTKNAAVVDYYLESVELLLFVPRQLSIVQKAALPIEWRDNSEMRARFIDKIRMLSATFYKVAGRSVVECVQIGSQREAEREALEKCGQLADEISTAIGASSPQTPKTAAEVTVEKFEDESKTLPDCVFSGGANDLNHRLAPSDGGDSLGRLTAARFERFTLKKKTEAQHRVLITWPLIGEFQLEGLPTLLTREKLTFLSGHVWHPKNAPVNASKAGLGEAQVEVQLPGRAHAITQTVSCEELALATRPPLTFRDGVPFLTVSTGLSATKDGPEIAKVGGPLAGIEILERSGDRAQVRSEPNPFVMFEGWISDSSIARLPRTGVTAKSSRTVSGTHQTVAGAQVLLDRKTPLSVATGVPLIVVHEEGPWAEIRLAGFTPSAGSSLFVKKEHFKSRTTTSRAFQ